MSCYNNDAAPRVRRHDARLRSNRGRCGPGSLEDPRASRFARPPASSISSWVSPAIFFRPDSDPIGRHHPHGTDRTAAPFASRRKPSEGAARPLGPRTPSRHQLRAGQDCLHSPLPRRQGFSRDGRWQKRCPARSTRPWKKMCRRSHFRAPSCLATSSQTIQSSQTGCLKTHRHYLRNFQRFPGVRLAPRTGSSAPIDARLSSASDASGSQGRRGRPDRDRSTRSLLQEAAGSTTRSRIVSLSVGRELGDAAPQQALSHEHGQQAARRHRGARFAEEPAKIRYRLRGPKQPVPTAAR